MRDPLRCRLAERKLPSRKKRASKGHAIRVSDEVYDTLDTQRKRRSWDWLFRRMLGLPDRAGNPQPLIEGMVEVLTGRFFLREPGRSWEDLETDAYELAIITAAKQKLKRVPRPLKMRELP